MRSAVAAILITCAHCSLSCAAPAPMAVSGIVANGQSITITGTGFGGHADNNANRPYICKGWENFESGVADSIFSANYGPELISGGTAQKQNSSYAARGYYWGTPRTYTNVWGQSITSATSYGFHIDLQQETPNKQKKIFISGWFMFPDGFDVGISYDTTMADQTKFLAVSPLGTLGGADGAKTYFQTRKSATIPLRTETEDGHPSEGDTDPLFSYAPMGSWHRFDIYVDLTKPDGQKVHTWYVDGKRVPRTNQFYNNDAALTARGVIDGFNYLSWLMYQFQGTDEYPWPQYMDDAYADFTQARVELSAYPSWDETAQHHKELQIPTVWSDTSITTTVNQGQFLAGQTAYLYVVHDDGAVNAAGYPVTIGGAGSSSVRPATLRGSNGPGKTSDAGSARLW